MNLLCLGDVVGKNGCNALRSILPKLRAENDIDLCVANGENSAEGNGVLPNSAEHLFTSGVDIITGGNHSYRRREIYDMMDSCDYLLRPANMPLGAVGHGSCVYDMGRNIVGVINLSGCVYMEPADNPFDTADREIKRLSERGANIIIVDIHAEATAEKQVLARYLDSRVSVVFGTHTHTQTNDLQILPGGTGFITDLGMCGPKNSVLGVKPELAIEKMRLRMPVRFENAEGESVICGAIFTLNDKTHACVDTKLIKISVNCE